MKTHKEQMEYLKKYDPISYYEMGGVNKTSNDAENLFTIIMGLFMAVGLLTLFAFLLT